MPTSEALAESEDANIAPWTVVELWKQYQHTLACPPPARAEKAAALRLEDFPDQLYETWHREFGSRPLKDFKQCFAERGLLLDILQDLCGVNIECMAGPFNQHFRFPLRFSASAGDWIFGMQHNSLHCFETGLRRRWLDFANLLPPPPACGDRCWQCSLT